MASSVAEDLRLDDMEVEHVQVMHIEVEHLQVEEINVEEIDVEEINVDSESEDSGSENIQVEDVGIEEVVGGALEVEEIEIDQNDPTTQPYVPLFKRIVFQGPPMRPQNGSLLLTKLAPEIRWRIWKLVLTNYENFDDRYSTKTYYSRPSYRGPRKTACGLLRTCRQIFAESFCLLFPIKQQIHWICDDDRAPPEYIEPLDLMQLRAILSMVPQQLDVAEVQYDRLQTFAQMHRLEDGSLAALLSITGQHPRRLTLTIRHTDWWHWEEDKDLRFNAAWIEGVSRALPLSCYEVTLELESLERKKDQVDTLAKHISERWFFKRRDGVVLFPDASGRCHKASRWTGSSTFNGRRWKEQESRKFRIDYYVLAINFVPLLHLEAKGGIRSPEAIRDAADKDFFHVTAKLEDSDDEDEFEDDDDDSDEDEGDNADNGDDAGGDNDEAGDSDDTETDETDSSEGESDFE